MKYWVKSEGFSNQDLKMVSLKFDGYNPVIVNEDDVDGTNPPSTPGQLIFELKYAVAAEEIEIILIVDILRDLPADNEDTISGT